MGLISTLVNSDLREREMAQQQAARDQANRFKLLEEQGKLRKSLDDAYTTLGDNPSQLGKTIDDLFKAYNEVAVGLGGTPASPDVIKALKDPQFAPVVLDTSAQQGVTMDQLFKEGANARLRAEARMAAAKYTRNKAAEEAIGGTPSAPQPATAGGMGLQMPGVVGQPFVPTNPDQVAQAGTAQSQSAGPAGVPPAVSTPAPAVSPAGPVAAPTPALQAAAEQLAAQIEAKRERLRVAIRNGAPPAAYAPLTAEITADTNRLFELTSAAALKKAQSTAEADLRTVPPEVLRETQLPPGTREGDLRAVSGAKLMTPAQQEGTKGVAAVSQKELGEIIDQGRVARNALPLYTTAAVAAQNAGVMGPLATPLRETAYNIANLLGIQPKGQTSLQLIDSITPKLAVVLTSQMKGSQSDREFLAGIQSAINKGQTNQAYAVLTYLGNEIAKRNVEQEIQARRWVANPDHPSLNMKDGNGRTFQEAFDKFIAEQDAAHGSLGERTAAALRLNYAKLLKNGVIQQVESPAAGR